MKILVSLALALLINKEVNAQSIKPEEVKDHIGEDVKVCGKVYGVYHSTKSNAQPTFINFGADYPNSLFTVVVWGDTRSKFSYPLEELDEQQVCVKGIIKLDLKQKPQIIVLKAEQIEIKE